MPSQALRMLSDVAALRAGLRGWQQVGEGPFLAPDRSLGVGAVGMAVWSQAQDIVPGAHRWHPYCFVQVALLKPSLKATGEVGGWGS